MNFIDIFFVLIIVLAAWKGYKKGLIIELFTVLAVFAGLYAGLHLSDAVTRWLYGIGWEWKYLPTFSFFLCFLGIGAMLYFGGKVLDRVIRVAQLGLLNRLIGMLLSMVTSVLLLGALVLIFNSYDERSDIIDHKTKKGSLLYFPVLNFTEALLPIAQESTLYMRNTLHKEPNEILKK